MGAGLVEDEPGRWVAAGPLTVGRARESAELSGHLDAALAGRGGVVLLAGEPGIGKTHLARALTEQAQAAGALVAWGSCWEGGAAPALWSWTQALRGMVAAVDPATLADAAGPGAVQLARLVPELRAALPALPPASSEASDQDRFLLFDAIAQFVTRSARHRPVVLVLDDLHWADQTSLLALEVLSRSLTGHRVLVLGTFRDVEAGQHEATRTALETVARAGAQLPLRGLGADALGGLIADRAGVPVDAALAAEVHAITSGNPFFAAELARMLVAEGRLDLATLAERGRGGRVGGLLPGGVRSAIQRRLAPLPASSEELLQVAAVAGQQLRVPILAGATGLDPVEVLDRLGAALVLGVIGPVPDQPGAFRFDHALVRETLYTALPTGRRAALHAAVARALEAARAPEDERDLAALAFHFGQAAALGAGEASASVAYAERAGRSALALAGYDRAVAHFRAGLGSLELLPADPSRRAALLQGVGEALVRDGDPAGSREQMREAAVLARRAGDVERLALVALASMSWAYSEGVDEWLVALLREAIAGLGEPVDPVPLELLARCTALLATSLYWVVDAAPERRALAERAVSLARALPEAGAEALPAQRALLFCLHRRQLATYGPASADEGLAESEAILALADAAQLPEAQTELHIWRLSVLLERSDLAGFERELGIVEHLAEDLRQPRAMVYLPMARGLLASIEGRFAEADGCIMQAGELAARSEGTIAQQGVGALLFTQRLLQGRAGELEPFVRGYAETQPQPAWRAALAALLAWDGRLEEAARLLDELAADGFASVPEDLNFTMTLALACEVASALQDAPRARRLHELLAPWAHHQVVVANAASVGPVTRYLALVAAAMGDWEEAEARWAQARGGAVRLRARAILARLDLDEAQARHRRDPADPGLPALVTDGRRRAATLGLDAVVERFDRLGTAAAEPEVPPTPELDEATLRREGDVWAVVFEGRTVRMRDAKGLHHLATLLARPGEEVHALDLATGPADAASRGRGGSGDGAPIARSANADLGPRLDPQAEAAYRERVGELREELEEARAFHDPERAARAQEELEFLARELTGAVGLGGRARPTGSDAEKARVNVTRAIRAVAKRLAELDARLGHELELTVRTGAFCSHRPDPRRPVRWTVEA